KLMSFIIESYNKIFSHFNNIKKYIAQANLNGSVEKEQEEKVLVLLSDKVDLGQFDPANVNVKKKEEEFYQLQSLLNSEKDGKNALWDENTLKDKSSLTDAIRDRKSTRLNSSHVSISYAVFCLKKKIKRKKEKRSSSYERVYTIAKDE